MASSDVLDCLGIQNSIKDLMAASRKRSGAMPWYSDPPRGSIEQLSYWLSLQFLLGPGKVETRGGGSHDSISCIGRMNNIEKGR